MSLNSASYNNNLFTTATNTVVVPNPGEALVLAPHGDLMTRWHIYDVMISAQGIAARLGLNDTTPGSSPLWRWYDSGCGSPISLGPFTLEWGGGLNISMFVKGQIEAVELLYSIRYYKESRAPQ